MLIGPQCCCGNIITDPWEDYKNEGGEIVSALSCCPAGGIPKLLSVLFGAVTNNCGTDSPGSSLCTTFPYPLPQHCDDFSGSTIIVESGEGLDSCNVGGSCWAGAVQDYTDTGIGIYSLCVILFAPPVYFNAIAIGISPISETQLIVNLQLIQSCFTDDCNPRIIYRKVFDKGDICYPENYPLVLDWFSGGGDCIFPATVSVSPG